MKSHLTEIKTLIAYSFSSTFNILYVKREGFKKKKLGIFPKGGLPILAPFPNFFYLFLNMV